MHDIIVNEVVIFTTNENELNNMIISKLVTFIEGDPKAPFSIATTLRRRGGC